MDLKNLATQFLNNKLGSDVDASQAGSALEGLLGGGGIGDLVGKLKDSGLAEQAQSWLGDGENAAVSAAQITEALDVEQIKGFADKLGIDQGNAAETISNLLPGLVDKASSGGDLLENVGGLGGLAAMAKKYF